jgi:energy-coupling factor transporter transmembrane protein EcfT
MTPHAGHREYLDPLSRMAMAGCISACALGPTSALCLFLLGCGCLCWTVAAAMPAMHLLRRMKKSTVFLLVIIVTGGISGGGKVLLHEGGVYLTLEGLEGGLVQSVRLLLVVWGATLFVWTTRPEELLDAVERWMVRKGRPVLAAGVIAMSYLPVLVRSARRIMIARRARGEPGSRWSPGGISGVARSSLPLFAAAFRDADMLAEAMEARCFDPLAPRSRFSRRRTSRLGIMVISCSSALVTAVLLGIL